MNWVEYCDALWKERFPLPIIERRLSPSAEYRPGSTARDDRARETSLRLPHPNRTEWVDYCDELRNERFMRTAIEGKVGDHP